MIEIVWRVFVQRIWDIFENRAEAGNRDWRMVRLKMI